MEIQESRRFQCDCRSRETFRLDPHRTESGDQPIQGSEIGCAAARAIYDQKLMFDENGLGNHKTHTTGASDSENGGEEMDEENNQIAHGHMVQGENKAGFWQNLRIRHQPVRQIHGEPNENLR